MALLTKQETFFKNKLIQLETQVTSHMKQFWKATTITHNAADKCIVQEQVDSLWSIAHNIINETEGVADDVVGQTTNIKHVSVDKI